jgi:hypothetical protein
MIKEGPTLQTCKACGSSGAGNFCAIGGQTFKTKRITLKGLLHDVFHFFTHLEKGFGYTAKQLAIAPAKCSGNTSEWCKKPLSETLFHVSSFAPL